MIKTNLKGSLRIFSAAAALSCGVIVGAHFLRQLGVSFNPALLASAEVIAALLGFTIAANIWVRFDGTGDRFALLVGTAFGLDGWIQLTAILGLRGELVSRGLAMRVPLYWMAGRTVLGVLLLAAIGLEKWLPWPREPRRTAFAVLSVVGAIAGLTGFIFLLLGHGPLIHSASRIPRPWDLVPAGMFLAAAILLYRSSRPRSAFVIALPWVAAMNAACHLVATQSAQLLDAPAFAAQLLNSFVGLDWGSQKTCLDSPARRRRQAQTGRRRYHTRSHRGLGRRSPRRFAGQPVAVALEQKRGSVVNLLLPYAHLVLFPVPASMSASYRKTFVPSGAKDDPSDASWILDLLLRHRDRLRRLEPDEPNTRLLLMLVEDRRQLVDDKTRLALRLQDCLKQYFPQLVQWFDVDTPLVADMLQRWPDLQHLQRCHDGTLRTFFRQHHYGEDPHRPADRRHPRGRCGDQ